MTKNIKNIIEAKFKREDLGSDIKTVLFKEAKQPEFNYLSYLIDYAIEEPIIMFYRNNNHWFIITTKRLIYKKSKKRMIDLKSIKSVSIDYQNKRDIKKTEISEIILYLFTNEKILFEVEKGTCWAIFGIMQYLANNNTN